MVNAPWLVLLLAIAGFFLAISAPAADVTIRGRQILVNGAPFFMKGICYTPTPPGVSGRRPPNGDFFTTNFQALYKRDLPRIRDMGANCVRVYGWNPLTNHTEFLDLAWNGGDRPLYVLIGDWIPEGLDWRDPRNNAIAQARWRAIVINSVAHPAVLGYTIGNELNGWQLENPVFWRGLNDTAKVVSDLAPRKIISTILRDDMLTQQLKRHDATMTAINVWCVNLFRGQTFGVFFDEYPGVSSKPALVTEFGLDAFDRRSGREYADNGLMQSDVVCSLWRQLQAHADICSGGSVYSWVDEWWRIGSPQRQEPGGWPNGAFPDGWADEDYWGLNRLATDGSGSIEPRAVLNSLKKLWTASDTPKPVSTDRAAVKPARE
jgi:beta-galactosidase/beta-glucuronidase